MKDVQCGGNAEEERQLPAAMTTEAVVGFIMQRPCKMATVVGGAMHSEVVVGMGSCWIKGTGALL